jgi:DNA-binding GntR family transcriptional regulator
MALSSGSLAGYRTKTDLVYDVLHREILAGRYRPGSRIVVDQVASQLGVSKLPVRGAVDRLVGEGWLQARPHVGAIVPELSPEEVLETSIIRAIVEGAAVRIAATHARPEIVERLREVTDRMDAAGATDDPEYPELNYQFHALTFRACTYPALRSMAMDLLGKTCRLRTVRFLPSYLPRSQQEHRSLIDAIARQDGDRAEQIVRQHVEHAGRLLWQYAVELTQSEAEGQRKAR